MAVISTVVIPAFNESENIKKTIEELVYFYGDKINVFVVVDNENDSTIEVFNRIISKPINYRIVVQNYGIGPANAIRFGIDQSETDCVTVMMADGSDDFRVILDLANLVNRGVAIACASRYMAGGQLIGGPRLKKFLSRIAGLTLYTFAGIGTHDPTNSFKAYSKEFLNRISIESRDGFEIGIELVSKAHRLRMPIAEVPTIWLDRTLGNSKFMLAKWLPKYLKWFFYCFGRSINSDDGVSGGQN